MRSKDLLPIKKEFYIILHERHNGLGPIEETQALINVTNGRKTFKKGKSNNNVPIVANWVTLLRFVIKNMDFHLHTRKYGFIIHSITQLKKKLT